MSGKKTHEPEKNLPSCWWEPQPMRKENGAADGGAAEKRILSGLLISGKNWVFKVKKQV